MKNLIVQVCAIVFLTGIVAPEGCALTIDLGGFCKAGSQTSSATTMTACEPSRCALPNPLLSPGRWNDGLNGEAARGLFGIAHTESGDATFSADPATLCITTDSIGASRFYPVIPDAHGSIRERLLSEYQKAGSPSPGIWSIFLTGVGLMFLSGMKSRKRRLSSPTEVLDLPVQKNPYLIEPLLREKLEGKEERRAHSIAA